ncbi:hypothetical protein [Kribbella sp. NPDC050470]|uniref:hypothetical protein n=1 Tax=unclassified Kribbella TaxID=2644121 RepID=UPI0037BC1E1E
MRGLAVALERLADHFRRTEDLGWMYGQGSVIAGLTDDSDLDLILIWADEAPTAATLPAPSTITRHGQLALEHGRMDGYDVDLMHVPRRTFDCWMSELEQGDGWSGTAWPLPIHVAAGLAESKLLLDPTGHGAEHRARAQTPAESLVVNVRRHLDTAAPGFIKELYRAAERDNRWLHASLAVELHKLVYTAWFLSEGHYPPFPKYLPQWYDRFGMSPEIQHLESTYWATSDPAEATAVLESLVTAVLDHRSV